MELNKEKLKKAVIKYLRKGCKKCPDFRTGKPRLLVNPDCACVSFLKDVENKTKEIKNILNYYSMTDKHKEIKQAYKWAKDENIKLKKRLENVYSGEYTDEQLKGAVVDIDKWEVWIDLW
jgi:hypothetical protein